MNAIKLPNGKTFEPIDPSQGTVIRQPPGSGKGYWVGAPGAMFDPRDETFYLLYRVRRPRGVESDRGAELHLACSRDGIEFDTVWTGTKDQLGTASLERCAIRRIADDRWILYVSYVDPADGRWRVDLVEATRVDTFDLANRKRVFTAADIDVEGVKDPFVFDVDGTFHMIVSFATSTADSTTDDLHGTLDAYNTGLIRSATGLATSQNGIDWQWEGEIFGPSSDGWDKYCARIGCVWRADDLWLALYDGSADVSENYEERAGLAYSHDLREFHRVTNEHPLMNPPHGPGSLRYFDLVESYDAAYFYYEMARTDGSHDLRVYRLRDN